SVASLAFDLVHRDRTLSVTLSHATLRIEVEPGAVVPVFIGVRGKVTGLCPGEVLEVELDPG
ncbi:glycosyl hydrolase family 65 protein, partial [Iamia sp.]|uniref:glycosyl hydrolase family 65 protein n=1 Tax=Iamia sp. TaxID=2722710 RepID=UPI002CA9FB84